MFSFHILNQEICTCWLFTEINIPILCVADRSTFNFDRYWYNLNTFLNALLILLLVWNTDSSLLQVVWQELVTMGIQAQTCVLHHPQTPQRCQVLPVIWQSRPLQLVRLLLSYMLCNNLTNNLLVREVWGCHRYADKNWNNVGIWYYVSWYYSPINTVSYLRRPI